MQSKPYDVVLLPSEDLAEKALNLSEKLKTSGVHFTLDNRTFFPHISLYMLQLNDEGLEKAKNLLREVASKNATIKAVAQSYHYENEYLDIEYIRSDEFVALQEQIIDSLNPVRDGLRERDKERLADAVGETRSNIMKYGYRSVGNMFNPHMTFTRFKNNQTDVMKNLPSKETFNGEYALLGLFEMGDNGTCVKKIGAWELQDS